MLRVAANTARHQRQIKILTACSNRGFIDEIKHGLEGIDELTLMAMIDSESRVFDSKSPLGHDLEGRLILYDGLAINL